VRQPRPLVAFFGHHKCATQWIRRIATDICKVTGRELLVFNGPKQFGGDLVAAIGDPSSTFLCYMNADLTYVRPLERTYPTFRGFHIIRDPRDVVVSTYYSHLYSHPLFEGLEEKREKLKSISKDEGLTFVLRDRRHQFTAMLEWDYAQPNVLELRMEDVTADATWEVPRIVDFLGLGALDGLDKAAVQDIVAAHDFTIMAGRNQGEEDVMSHYRKGVKGDWMNHFRPQHVAYFKKHYGELLMRLGYETDDNWGSSS
jgi:hypothetical protein